MACPVTEDDDLMIGRLAANLSGARRVDLCWCDEHGVERMRLSDIPLRADAAGIVLQEPIALMKASPTATQIARLLGEFTFHHTRTLPGPGAW
jgi:hypothetical protein